MKRKTVSEIMLTLLLMSMLTLAFNIQPVKAEPGTIYIRADGSVDPPTAPIQRVGNVYTFTGNITDSIEVQRDNIVIDGAGYTVQGTMAQYSIGITLTGRVNVTIQNTNIKRFSSGIGLGGGSNNNIYGNNIENNIKDGIALWGASGNKIYENNIKNSGDGGIGLGGGSNNNIYGNNIENNIDYGITLGETSGNKIYENNIKNSGDGIRLRSSSNNLIYHNNFVTNQRQVYDFGSVPASINAWDDGYPSGGNYWSDYAGVDGKSGPNQDQLGSDGIGDIPYVIDANNRDRYPLMKTWTPTQPTPDFSITASPTSLTIQQGSSGTSVITITSIGGFDQPVQLTVSGEPSGVTASLNPEQITPPPDGTITSTLTVSVGASATPGSYTLTVTGTSGTLTHSVDITMEITGAPPTLIAGKDVPAEAPDFFAGVLTKLNIPTSQFALQALTIWTSYENTNAYWNPLATTWGMGEKSWDFNEARVQNYIDKETGIQATANTLALPYYESIREMLAMQSFNEQNLRDAVAYWTFGTDFASIPDPDLNKPYVVNLVNEWRDIYSAGSRVPPTEAFPVWTVGVAVAIIAIATGATLFLRRRK